MPLPLMHRSLVIPMERNDGRRELKRLDRDDADTKADLNIAYRMIFTWARDAEINSDPPLPAQLRNRQADNWRPLIAIADAFSADWATRAREAAVAFAGEHRDEDAAVVLLRDIRDIFDMRGVDRLPSKTIVDDLHGADDAMWPEWRGINGNQQPRKLSQGELAKLLEPFQIRPRTIRTFSNASAKPTAKGHYRHSLRRPGAHIAQTASRRHNLEISGTCGVYRASHPHSHGVRFRQRSEPEVRIRRLRPS
jgi:Protein of unknown function (DUF3631)